MSEFPQTPRNRVERLRDRARYDRETIWPIVDEATICHVGFVENGQPFVIPTLHGRDGDAIVIHGAVASRLMQHVGAGHPVSLAMTLVDGLVLARSHFHHSINYRSAVLFGRGHLLTDERARLAALERIIERLVPGRWAEARPPNARELKATAVARIEVESASAKVRTGPPLDDEADLALPHWAGVLPLAEVAGAPEADPTLAPGVAVPASVRGRATRRR
ncbi:MAG TPA: pyridoxamine 5'-phosphate oxidase family protein [Anaeromyxobacteraceae bacterium]|nr:pyridoxamine 5'-phosphate oxidase family protein [Anaeromyxobacteraceae bacterium]